MKILKVLIGLIFLIVFCCGCVNENYNSGKKESYSKKNLKHIKIIDRDKRTEVELPFENLSSFSSYKDDIYISVGDKNPYGMANKLINFNKKTKKVTTLFTSKFSDPSVQGVQTNGKWLTWIDSDGYGTKINIYLMNIETKKIEAVMHENDPSIQNSFPVLSDSHLAWIYYDRKKEKSYVMIRDLNKHRNTKIHSLNSHTLQNNDLSVQNKKILFTDVEKKGGICYIYDIPKQKLYHFRVPHKNIGWGELLNDHQFVYLSFNSSSFSDNKLVLYNTSTKKVKEFSNKKMGVDGLQKDSSNHLFVHMDGYEDYQIYKVNENTITKLGKLNESDIFDISTNQMGDYLMMKDKTDKRSSLLITTSDLPLN
ncbi:hypothetical protein [Fictibacillus gelatini]|uniref:hypothetical protein n=1 Tax=Fictibacillus gelatini TaxID=225985 RepID=UPI0004014B2E|nr:hypothetical protein [Fictibacillus gelatini]